MPAQRTKLSPESRFTAIVLYDGYCVLCNWFVRVVLRLDTTGVIGFAPLESDIGRTIHTDLPEGTDSVVMVEGDEVRVKSEAMFRLLQLVGGM